MRWHDDLVKSEQLFPVTRTDGHALGVGPTDNERDALTATLSRPAFVAAVAARAERTSKDGETFGLCVVDLDHFKNINLSHGPACGDEALRDIAQRLVRTNPRNGRRNYYVGSHARSIIGWSGVDSRRLIDELNEFVTTEDSRLTQRWSPGDTVIWDNRCVLHRGTGYDADRHRRLMRQTRVRGAGPTLEE